MTYKNRLKIFVVGEHPLLEMVTSHLQGLGAVFVDKDSADFALVGGSNVQDYGLNIPVFLLSSYSMFKGTSSRSQIDEGMPYCLHPLADFMPLAFPFVKSEYKFLSSIYPVMCVRVFPVFGPGAPDNLVNRLIDSAKDCGVLEEPLYGYRRRSWLHTSDFIRGIDSLLSEFLKGTTGIFNLGSNSPISIRELYTTVWQLAGFDYSSMVEEEWKELPWRPDILIPDLTRTIAVTKWRPRTSLRAGIKEMLNDK